MRAGGTEEARDGGREGAEAGGEREGAGCGAWALLLRPHAYTRPRTDTDSTCPSPHATCRDIRRQAGSDSAREATATAARVLAAGNDGCESSDSRGRCGAGGRAMCMGAA